MSVLKGEGRVPILFGSTSISVATTIHGGYLARPDLTGEWPTIVLVPSAWGVTSAVKDLCRRLSRQGFAVVAPDLYRGKAPDRKAPAEEAVAAFEAVPAARALADLDDVVEFITNPAGFWSSAEYGFGLLGVGDGGRLAAATAGRTADLAALALAYTPPAHLDLSAVTVPILGLYGRADTRIPVDEIMAVRSIAPHAELVLYEDVDHDFLDDYLDTWNGPAERDAIERLTAFFEKHLPPAPD